MVVREEYYDPDELSSVSDTVYRAKYEVSTDVASSEQEALDRLWSEQLVHSDFGTIQRCAAESSKQGTYYDVQVVFGSTEIGGTTSVSDKNAVEVEKQTVVRKLLNKLGL